MALQAPALASLPSLGDALAVLTTRNIFAFLICGWVIYQLSRAAWNISSFHPLSHIPGPRLAAATYLPEFWYDAVKFGRYTHEIIKWHDIYGPIIRINPHEVHCSDANFVDEIYAAGGRKRDKPSFQVGGTTMENSGFATADHDHHRLRRGPVAKFFSRSQVSRLEPQVLAQTQRLCDELLAQAGKDEPFDVTMAYSCFTADTISDYCFGESFGFLSQGSWEPNFRRPLYALLKTVFLFRFFPFLRNATIAATWFSNYLPADMALLIRTFNTDVPKQVQKAHADKAAGLSDSRPTVFGELLRSELPPHEKTLRRLTDEAISLLGGGTETVSWTLALITYFLLTQPRTLDKLTAELRAAVDDAEGRDLPSWTVLEHLPYLGAVVQEGLRLSYGVSARTARVATEEDLVYRGEWTRPSHSSGKINSGGKDGKGKVSFEYVIPRGYAIGMSAALTHHDESLFPDSYAFAPERWLDDQMQRRKELERCFLSFSKGSRACLGMNLALCELHFALAALTLRVFPRMRLFETTEEDIRWDHDMFIPQTKDGSKGVRVVIL